MSKLRPIVVIVFLFFFLKAEVNAQGPTSPFNGLVLSGDTVAGDFSFLLTGHLHGSSTNVSGFPASSLLANLDNINSLEANFMISLGDLFLDVDDYYIANYKKSFFDNLKIPLFNAVGNHDLSGNLYERYFGATYSHFIFNNSLFVFLDTEMNDGSIKGEQMEFFKKVIEEAKNDSQILNVFISSHRPIWAENNPAYQNFFKENTRTQFGSNNFETEVFPLLAEFLSNKNVYWFSGSFGAAPASFFYDKHETSNITYIITAIRDLKRDAMLNVKVGGNGEVAFIPVSLTEQSLNDLEAYNIEYWKKNSRHTESKFNWRLLPYLTIQMIMHYYFWIGLFSGTIITIFILIIFRKRRKMSGISRKSF